jgi:dienelactone hydrolase
MGSGFVSSHLRRIVAAAGFAVVALTLSTAHAQVARLEILSIPSTTLSDEQFLTGEKEGKPVALGAELRLPRPGTARLPAVVLLHGSGGIGGAVVNWAQFFNEMGVATLVVDSFTARGISNTVTDQAQLGRLAMTVDAYRALEVLAKHPRIDPTRIAVMGFSRGAQPALYASMKRFQRDYAPAGREFAAYIAFYAPCGTRYGEDEDVSDHPIRLFHGSADDYNPVAPCRAYVERLRAAKKDVRLTEYASAAHVFDEPALSRPFKLDKAQTTRNCELTEGRNGVILNAKTYKPFSYADPCVEYGPTIAFDEKAYAASRKAVAELVTEVLRP